MSGAPERVRFRAGCGRETVRSAALPELAYTELAFPECDGCPHRIVPERGPAFCRWLPAARPHPFAELARVRVEEDRA